MLNKLKNTIKRNKKDDSSLLEAEQLIKKAQFPEQPASNDFREALKSKIMEKRQKKNYMKNLTKSFASMFTVRRLTPVVSFMVIVALVLTTMHYWPAQDEFSPYGKFARLIISPAYAHDNFEIEVTKGDSIGVDSDTEFVIKSKEAIDFDLLKENISLYPTIAYEVKKVNDNEFKVIPAEPLEEKTVYNVQIAASYIAENGLEVSSDYSWAFQVRDNFKVIGSLPRDKGSQVPTNTGVEVTFSHENFINYDKAFSIEPKVDGRFEVHKRTLVFVPAAELKKGTIYSVKIDKNIISLQGSDKELSQDYVFQFETVPEGTVTQRQSSSFSFSDDFVDFSPQNEPFFQVYMYNMKVEKVPFKVYSFKSVDNFIKLLQDRTKYPYWSYRSSEDYDINYEQLNEVSDYELELVEVSHRKFIALPETLPEGFYVGEVKIEDVTRRVLFQVTNISAYANITTNKTLVWVNDLATKKPISNAEVELLHNGLKTKTDKTGVALVETKQLEDTDIRDYYIKVSDGNRALIVNFQYNFYYANFEREGETNELDPQDYWRYFDTDRNMYKETDSVNFWGFVTGRENQIKDIEKVTVQVTNNRYYDYYNDPIPVVEKEVTVSNDGSYSGSLELMNLLPDHYSLDVMVDDKVISSAYFSVEDYVKPAYKFSAIPVKKYIYSGENIEVDIEASFFEGTPVSQLEIDASGQNLITNDKGLAVYSRGTSPLDCSLDSDKYYCNYPDYQNINIKPKNSELADINKYVSVQVFNSSVQSALKVERSKDEKSAEVKLTVRDLHLDKYNSGEEQFTYFDSEKDDYDPAENKKVQAKVIEIEYLKIKTGDYYDFVNKVRRDTYRYEKKETELMRFDGMTDSQGKFNYNLTNLDPEKGYEIVVSVTDNQGRNNVSSAGAYLYGSGYYYGDVDSYTLRFSKEGPYKIGEEVEADFVKNDELLENGEGHAYLYMKLRRGLVDYEISSLSNYKFKFQKEYIPNIYFDGIYFDGQTYHESSHNYWAGESSNLITYDYTEKELDLEVQTDKKEYKPGEEMQIRVKVKDQDGKSVKSELNISLVDEAFFALSEDYGSILPKLYQNLPSGKIVTAVTHEEAALGMKAEGGGCFLEGTKIKMADGTEKNIEDIQVDDQILTFNNPITRKLVAGEVTNTFEHIVDGYLLINDNLKVTPEHMVWLNSGWQMIGQARVGDILLDKNGVYVTIESIEKVQELVKVYNITVKDYHTYIADGIYVHNDKGGPREDFVDTAYFETVSTNGNGEAEFTVEAPDNLTSWRITVQAISEDVYAGQNKANVNVVLPAFVMATFNDEYLTVDQPIVKLRAYGDELVSGDKAKFTVESKDLGVDKITKDGEAFKPTYVGLGKLTEGESKIRFDMESSKGDDAMINDIKVVQSRLTEGEQTFYELSEGLKPEGSADGLTTLVLSDENQGKYYQKLNRLGWTWGDRVEQKLARIISRDLKETYFEDEYPFKENFQASNYQLQEGSIAILPYSDGEFELSAKVAALNTDYFDNKALESYFYKKLTDKNSNAEEVVMSLYGLASLKAPVLLAIQNMAQVEELSVKEKLYLGLAAYEIGDFGLAKDIYYSVIEENAEELNQYIRIKIGQDKDDYLQHTVLAALLAAGLNEKNADGLWQYVEENYTKDILIKLEELNYIENALPNVAPGEVSFEMYVNGEKYEKTLEKGRSVRCRLNPEQLKTVEFKNVQGNVGLVSHYDKPINISQVERSDYVSVKREYYDLKGNKLDKFTEQDIVEIRIYPTINADSIEGSYQIIDLVPSGLEPITSRYSYYRLRGNYSCSRHPYEVDGQKVKFLLYKNWNKFSNCSDYFKYYARVVNPGEYMAEPAVIQSMKAHDIKNYSEDQKITITQ